MNEFIAPDSNVASSSPVPASLGIGEMFKVAWHTYINNLGKVVGLMLLPSLIFMIGGLIFASNPIIGAIVSILGLIFIFAANFALVYLFVNKTGTFKELVIIGLKNLHSVAWVNILNAGIVMLVPALLLIIFIVTFPVGYIPVLILVALYMPVSIYISFKYIFASFVLVAESDKGAAALVKSGIYTKGNKLKIFGKLLIWLVIITVTSALFSGNKVLSQVWDLVIALTFTPMFLAYLTELYLRIKHNKGEIVQPTKEQRTRTLAAGLAGCLLIIVAAMVYLMGSFVGLQWP